MTTSLFAIASLLASATGHGIHVGDQAHYTGTYGQGSAVMDVALSLKVTGYDAARGQYVVETTQTMMGQTQTAVTPRAANEIGDDATAQQIVDQCSSFGGELEGVSVGFPPPAEMLNTCKITQGDSSSTQVINIGVVPFMIVKYVDTQSDGTTTKLHLQSYARGQ